MSEVSLFDHLSVVVTERGVARVDFQNKGETGPGANGHPADSACSTLEHEALHQIAEYLRGQRTTFDLPLDIRSATPFQRAVLEELRTVPFGQTVTYGELARRVSCRSPRAVGQAVGRNPLPIVIPCHRVIAGDARLGGFSGGIHRKVALLRIEGIRTRGSAFSSRIRAVRP